MRVSAVVVAAGNGLRFKSKVSKPLARIDSKPIIVYCLAALQRHPLISEIILVVNPANKKAIAAQIKQHRINKVRSIVEGGLRRQDSVYCGLKKVSADADLILVHDAARPFVAKEEVSALIKEAAESGAAVAGVPVKATIKEVKGQRSKVKGGLVVEKTLNRDNLWEIQTPQVFRRELILEAYKKFGGQEVTDDAALVERMGRRVSIVPGSYRNIKITTPEDLVIARAIIKG